LDFWNHLSPKTQPDIADLKKSDRYIGFTFLGVLILVFITTSTCLEFIDPPGNSIETPRIRQYGNFSECVFLFPPFILFFCYQFGLR
jgi:hypothetical protein